MKRILFVDDESNVLEGLQRLLRPQRKQWDMLFATGADEALAILEKSQVDVVVTDMLMPGMDGASLLQVVHCRYPDTMRIILSGHFDVETGMRAVPVAHQFLMKPCDPEKLKAAIERAADLNPSLPGEAAKRVVSQIGTLPSPSLTCIALMDAINDPDTSLLAIGGIIAQDVALTAKVLQLVNSAFFSLSSDVVDVKKAVSLLGLELIKQLVLSAAILKQFEPTPSILYFSLDDLEKHSRLTAQIAAKLPVLPQIENCRVMAALLHDAGKLVLASRLPDRFQEACLICADEKIPLHKAEERVFGISHAEVGAYLLSLWGLPKLVVDAIAAHHCPVGGEPTKHLDLPAAIHIANALAHDDGDADAPPIQLDIEYVRRLGVEGQLSNWREMARQVPH